MGPLIPHFGLLVTSPLGFKARVGSLMYLSFTTVSGFCYQLRFSIFIEMLVCYFRLVETREKVPSISIAVLGFQDKCGIPFNCHVISTRRKIIIPVGCSVLCFCVLCFTCVFKGIFQIL